MPDKNLKHAVEGLVDRIRADVTSSVNDGSLLAKDRVRTFLRFGDFSYDADGAHFKRGWTEFIRDWDLKQFRKLLDHFKSMREYLLVEECLQTQLPNFASRSTALDEFVHRLARSLIPGEDPTTSSFVSNFIAWINREKIYAQASVEIDGIVVLADPIRVEYGYTELLLRPTCLADLEKESRIGWKHDDFVSPPSAVLEIRTLGSIGEIRNCVHQSLSVLRLFAIGSIDYRCIKIRSCSFDGFSPGRLERTVLDPVPKFNYVVNPESRERLILLWKDLVTYLPPALSNAFPEPKDDHLTIAFERYSEALTLKLGFERTVSDCVMALEALFLTERYELRFRLKLFVAKVLGIAGYDPLKVAGDIKLAYDIRSSFVHGSTLERNDRKALERSYGDQDEFCEVLLDYARISIIVMMTIQSIPKKDVLKLIEESMLSATADDELKALVKNARFLIKLMGRRSKVQGLEKDTGLLPDAPGT